MFDSSEYTCFVPVDGTVVRTVPAAVTCRNYRHQLISFSLALCDRTCEFEFIKSNASILEVCTLPPGTVVIVGTDDTDEMALARQRAKYSNHICPSNTFKHKSLPIMTGETVYILYPGEIKHIYICNPFAEIVQNFAIVVHQRLADDLSAIQCVQNLHVRKVNSQEVISMMTKYETLCQQANDVSRNNIFYSHDDFRAFCISLDDEFKDICDDISQYGTRRYHAKRYGNYDIDDTDTTSCHDDTETETTSSCHDDAETDTVDSWHGDTGTDINKSIRWHDDAETATADSWHGDIGTDSDESIRWNDNDEEDWSDLHCVKKKIQQEFENAQRIVNEADTKISQYILRLFGYDDTNYMLRDEMMSLIKKNPSIYWPIHPTMASFLKFKLPSEFKILLVRTDVPYFTTDTTETSDRLTHIYFHQDTVRLDGHDNKTNMTHYAPFIVNIGIFWNTPSFLNSLDSILGITCDTDEVDDDYDDYAEDDKFMLLAEKWLSKTSESVCTSKNSKKRHTKSHTSYPVRGKELSRIEMRQMTVQIHHSDASPIQSVLSKKVCDSFPYKRLALRQHPKSSMRQLTPAEMKQRHGKFYS